MRLQENICAFGVSFENFQADITKTGVLCQDKRLLMLPVNVDIIIITGTEFMMMYSIFVPECNLKARVEPFGFAHIFKGFLRDCVFFYLSHCSPPFCVIKKAPGRYSRGLGLIVSIEPIFG